MALIPGLFHRIQHTRAAVWLLPTYTLVSCQPCRWWRVPRATAMKKTPGWRRKKRLRNLGKHWDGIPSDLSMETFRLGNALLLRLGHVFVKLPCLPTPLPLYKRFKDAVIRPSIAANLLSSHSFLSDLCLLGIIEVACVKQLPLPAEPSSCSPSVLVPSAEC